MSTTLPVIHRHHVDGQQAAAVRAFAADHLAQIAVAEVLDIFGAKKATLRPDQQPERATPPTHRRRWTR